MTSATSFAAQMRAARARADVIADLKGAASSDLLPRLRAVEAAKTGLLGDLSVVEQLKVKMAELDIAKKSVLPGFEGAVKTGQLIALADAKTRLAPQAAASFGKLVAGVGGYKALRDAALRQSMSDLLGPSLDTTALVRGLPAVQELTAFFEPGPPLEAVVGPAIKGIAVEHAAAPAPTRRPVVTPNDLVVMAVLIWPLMAAILEVSERQGLKITAGTAMVMAVVIVWKGLGRPTG